MRALWLFCIPCVLLLTSPATARLDSTDVVTDTTQTRVLTTTDTSQSIARKDFKPFYPSKSATLAVGLSAVLPGAGQIYNEDYWKAPIIWGLGGYWVYEWFHLNDRYKGFRDRFSESVKQLPPYGNERLLTIRDFYRDERDKFAWYLGALYFLNLVDAYVGANLYDFNVSPDLSTDGRIVPKVTASVRLRF
jgi:hypothetical protein